MIPAYTGLPGSGKSYSIVKRVIIPALKSGRHVYLNVPLQEKWLEENGYTDLVHYYEIPEFTEAWLDKFIKGSVLIIDEMYDLWPAGMKTEKVPEWQRGLLARHRHMVGENGRSTEIVFACQDLAQVASFARNMVDTTFRMTKLSSVGASSSMRVDIYRGAVTGPRPPASSKINQVFERYDPAVYAAYKSHTLSDTVEAGDETASDARTNVFKGVVPLLVLLLVVALSLFSYFTLSDFFKPDIPEEVVDTPPDQPTGADIELLASTPKVQTQTLPHRSKTAAKVDYFDKATVYINGITGFGPRDLSIRANFRNGSVSDLGVSDLRRLGYRLVVINPCAARLISDDTDKLIGCLPDETTAQVEHRPPSVLEALGSERP